MRAPRCIEGEAVPARCFFLSKEFYFIAAGAGCAGGAAPAGAVVSRWRAFFSHRLLVVLFEGTWADGAPLQATSVLPCLLPRKQLALVNPPLLFWLACL